MSIFGVKNTSGIKQEIRNLKNKFNIIETKITENHEWVKPRLINTFQSYKALDSRVDNIETNHKDLVSKVDNIETNINANHNWIRPRLIEMSQNHNALVNRVGNISDRNVINIFAERQGPLKRGSAFSFGDHSGFSPAGYMMAFPGQIIAFGLIGKRTNLNDDINIIINISNNPDSKISLTNSELSTHEKFVKPFRVDVGDEIKFISSSNSPSSTSTVISLIIELFI